MSAPLRLCPDGGSCSHWCGNKLNQCFNFCKRQKINAGRPDVESPEEEVVYRRLHLRTLRAPPGATREQAVDTAIVRILDGWLSYYGIVAVRGFAKNWLADDRYASAYHGSIRLQLGHLRPGPIDLPSEEIRERMKIAVPAWLARPDRSDDRDYPSNVRTGGGSSILS